MVAVDALIQASEHGSPAPLRSVRRATARRASSRRAYARSRQSDSDASIIDFLGHHPASTVGDLAKSLNLDPEHVATCLTHLTGAGEIQKTPHGYQRSAAGEDGGSQPGRDLRPVAGQLSAARTELERHESGLGGVAV
jgi:hypothetical protein